MSKIIVYDFDGTLSYGDSMEELFVSEMIGIKSVLKLYYYYLKVLSKLKLSTVKREKEKMIKLLFHSSDKRFREECEKQSIGYNLSPIISNLLGNIEQGNRVIVLSASSIYFLNSVFKEVKVEIYGTTFNSKDGIILGINQHPFYHEKIDILREHGIEVIDEAYFDSNWDDCIKPMCRVWHKVKNGEVVESGTNKI